MTEVNGDLSREWMQQASIEVVPGVMKRLANPEECLGKNQFVYITFLPQADYDSVINAAKIVQASQAVPVAHIGARHLRDRQHLENYIQALNETGVRHVLLLAGDRSTPVGPYDSSLALLETGLFDNGVFDSVGFAAHPAGHPQVAEQALRQAEQQKTEWGRQQPCRVYLLTQFVFDARDLFQWLAQYKQGDSLPVIAGLPGLTKTRTLLKFASMAGAGWGRVLGMFLRKPLHWLRFATNWSPDPLIAELAEYCQKQPQCSVDGLHFYTFGGFKRTALWLKDQ